MLNERAAADDGFWYPPDDSRSRYRPYVVTGDSILQIPVKGVLLHEFPFAFSSWATGYIYIQRAFERGMADPAVKGIALMCDSPGGEVAGCFDMVDKMFAIRDQKPVWGFAHEAAYSAAYATISISDKIWVSRTGGVGSIGVYTSHVDMSGWLKQQGLAVTLIDAPEGGHKVDGNPYQPLPDSVRARIQARIDELYEVFVSSVARNRGMEEQAVRDTQALTFSASQATSNGLADAIGSLDDAVAAFAADLSCEQGDEDMTIQNSATATAEQTAALATARAEGKTEGLAESKTVHAKEGAAAERERISGIVNCEAAKGRGDFALTLALTMPDCTAEQAAVLLAKTPEAAKPDASSTAFERAMAKNNPELGSGNAEATEQPLSERILAAKFGTAKRAA
jgi:signal peptide peptidase SppA